MTKKVIRNILLDRVEWQDAKSEYIPLDEDIVIEQQVYLRLDPQKVFEPTKLILTTKEIFIVDNIETKVLRQKIGIEWFKLMTYNHNLADIDEKIRKKCNFKKEDENKGFWVLKLKNHAESFMLGFVDEEKFNQWKNALSKICILSGYSDHYKTVKKIGKGGFSKVYMIRSLKNKKLTRAAKIVHKSKIIEKPSLKKMVRNEIRVLRSVNSPNIIEGFEVFETERNVVIVLEKINGGEVPNQKKINFNKANTIIYQVMKGLKAMNDKNFVHCDIKHDNILMDNSHKDITKCKIIDFGLSIDITKEKIDTSHLIGTPGYLAPESFLDDPVSLKNFHKRDVFSLGIIYYEMLTGIFPFDSNDHERMIQNNKNCQIRFDIPQLKKIPSEGKKLVRGMLEIDPRKRLSLTQAMKFGILSGENKFDGNFSKMNIQYSFKNSIHAPSTKFSKIEKKRINKTPFIRETKNVSGIGLEFPISRSMLSVLGSSGKKKQSEFSEGNSLTLLKAPSQESHPRLNTNGDDSSNQIDKFFTSKMDIDDIESSFFSDIDFYQGCEVQSTEIPEEDCPSFKMKLFNQKVKKAEISISKHLIKALP